jgi:hypothetical protein
MVISIIDDFDAGTQWQLMIWCTLQEEITQAEAGR